MKLIIDIDEDVLKRTVFYREFRDLNDCVTTIKALEKATPLDEVKSEIEQNAYPIVHGVNNHELGMSLYGIMQVFDKYKGDKE